MTSEQQKNSEQFTAKIIAMTAEDFRHIVFEPVELRPLTILNQRALNVELPLAGNL